MSSNASEKFSKFVSELFSQVAKPEGFRKRGNSFQLIRDGNIGIIAFQKSRDSREDEISFTVNLGVYSERVAGRGGLRSPAIEDCHWRMRIGSLLQISQDYWWSIDPSTSVEKLVGEFLPYIRDTAIPAVLKYLDDQQLRDLWFSGVSPGLTKYVRLRNLLALLKEIGPSNRIDEIERELSEL